MKKNNTEATRRKQIFKQARLTIGLDLGDRSSHYCMLDEAGNVILESNLPTTSNGIRQAFGRIPRCRIALETGTHSPWVSRQLSQMGHEVIVAHARNVRLIAEANGYARRWFPHVAQTWTLREEGRERHFDSRSNRSSEEPKRGTNRNG
jgi:hypothetical protein